MGVDAAREKNDGKQEMAVCERNMRPRRKMGCRVLLMIGWHSRLPRAVTMEFSVERGLALLACWLACLLQQRHGGGRETTKYGARAMAGLGDWA